MRQPTRSATDRSLGAQLADAIAAQDATALRACFSTPVTFQAVTPRRFWDAETPVGVSDIVLGVWFAPPKTVTGVTLVQNDAVGDVQKVTYRMTVDSASGVSVIEQTAYYSEQDGQITDLRLVCSGFRPC